ncbi:MAG: flagellar hook-associated protein FlgK [Gammaproteobacteria bacterium]|jgi:flagellar hook-associated protein 1 FlgK|uniref:flagellar hook-associated protein FlgK n=1 Tax=Pseudomonas TaxID=286 RepID=UPI000CBC5D9D|nr:MULTISPECIES: flagellar hook-associated protein FlgK [Pseudomonas]MDR7022871.1 flagellar hook-associated protein 1 FlgK [Pseudomonas peli]PJE43349.1 MAG: flagellar hook-associated protein FlgK [Pseudomonas sp.] [Pseudomonas sp. FEMGT703P]|tara:strand:+ start:2793 stop:4832 length:2040 start_codon:yes stop_codon:yes gene_type:complete
MADLLNIGLSGLAANKTSLAVTGHNITNVNTPGFSRQETVQATRIPQFSGAGYIGSGTTLVDVRRIYNEFLNTQVRSSTALNSDTQSYLGQINQLDSLLAGSTTGVNPGLQKVFAALQTAAEDPANIPARQLALSEAEGLAKRFNTVYDRLNEQNAFINKQLSAVTDQVNQLATSIAGYNEAIAVAASNGQQPNDLLDAREEAVRKLSTFIGVTVVAQDDNSYNLFVGSGQPLVVGSTASRLEVVPGLSDPLRSEVQFVSGNSRQGITSLITGGEMGGLIRYREDVLDTTLNSVGRLALSVTDQVNRQLGQGLDLNGQFGNGLFRELNDPELIGQRSLARIGNSDTTANLNVLIEDTTQLTTSDYEVEFTSATDYTVRRVSDGTSFGPFDITVVPAAEFDGVSLNVASGTFAAGDRFRVMPTRNAGESIRADMKRPEELAFAAPLKSQTSPANIGTGVISQPTLLTEIDIYDPVAQTNLETSLRNAPPLRIVMGAGGGATQGYDVVDINGNVIDTGVIVPGQNNKITITVPATAGPPAVPVPFDYEVAISGRPQGGDNFSVSFNTNGVSDNRNALKLIDLQNRTTIGINPLAPATTGSSFTDAYGDLVERVGTLTSQARVDGEATGAILKQATDNRDSISAVNLDEEAAKLIQFEQYYQASAQIIQVARSLFDTLINTF